MKKNVVETHSLRCKLTTNLVMSILVFCIGILCTLPLENETVSGGELPVVYSNASSQGIGVSMMFNVYWGTEEVYSILQTLEEHDAKATFFIGGCWADDNVECLRAIFSAGHEIGNHGYFHKDHDKLTLVENQKEISSCNRFIELSLGEAPVLFAPPSGAYSDDTVKAASLLGMKTILWSKDTIDWRDKNAALIYTRATKNVQRGDFILMHPMKETANALNDILKYYEQNDLKPVTVSENLQDRG